MTYTDYEEIYNHFRELEQQDRYILERLNAHEWFPVVTYVLCGFTIVLILGFLIWLFVQSYRENHGC